MRNIAWFFAALLTSMSITSASWATCSWTTLSNGTTANADQVMNNLDCLAPLASPSFTGNVGIGTASPTQKLHIYTPGGGTASFALIENGGTTVNDDIAALLLKGGGTNAYWALGTNRADIAGAAGNFFLYNATTNVKTVVVTPTANVGINTSTPNFAGFTAGSTVLSIYGTSQPGAALELVGGTSVVDGNVAGDIAFENANLTTSVRLALIRASMKGTASNDAGGQIDIFTKTNGGNLAAVMTITNAGKVGIGAASPAQALEVNGQIKVDSLASASGTALCINASGVIASCSSSRRYKEQIRTAAFGLKEIETMRPVTFKWKGRDEQDFGLIAEEVAKIDPRYVTYKDGKIEGVKYPQLTAVLVNAVKQLKAVNDSQASELTQLRAQNAAVAGQLQNVNSRLAALERRMPVRAAENLTIAHH